MPYPVNAGSKATGILRSGTASVRHAAINDEGIGRPLAGPPHSVTDESAGGARDLSMGPEGYLALVNGLRGFLLASRGDDADEG